ncbi:FAD-dependent oxidoreductase [Hyphomicrobium sp. CS1GBMeth3]|uniref:FAD-dependent oxidoreductase n=1 Tax=Hyphomicrobium sp. CS1GBMeth3 TaxID=1892845 RepID=UPI000931A72E|nr:FAD-dependent oxidoreductase [Hyphomicrobium sp. CS1GBMeth3]
MATEPESTRTSHPLDITVVGAGILGLWQALTLARTGHRVRLVEKSTNPFADSASRFAGAMLAPGCESETAPEVRDLGIRGLTLWRAVYPRLVNAGSLVVAAPRDTAEIARFGRATRPPETLDADAIAALEPDLAGRFVRAYYFPDEAHMTTPDALAFLLDAARNSGATVELGAAWTSPSASNVVIDCRGMAAADELPALRGVRGERLVVRTREIHLARPVRLLHPRHPLYVVPWTDDRYLVGATVIESEDTGAITVRSALELLGTAYALHPAFGEAEILETGAGIRPSFPDNLPHAEIRDGGNRILVNGAYRHGFLLAPVLAEAVAGYLANQAPHELLVFSERVAHPPRPV